jgi:hypothetical protein
MHFVSHVIPSPSSNFLPPNPEARSANAGEDEEESNIGHGSLDILDLLVPIIEILRDPITSQILHDSGR